MLAVRVVVWVRGAPNHSRILAYDCAGFIEVLPPCLGLGSPGQRDRPWAISAQTHLAHSGLNPSELMGRLGHLGQSCQAKISPLQRRSPLAVADRADPRGSPGESQAISP
ncbi:MAG: hypothetical protein EA001_06930 [Oscillatoriales cyanobacterium]|nr:MAG: hypothetical protein EA001_06930 [Oscillatoriales cyanobacterium]